MNKVVHALLWLLTFEAVTAVGLTVLNMVRLFETDYWIAIMIINVFIIKLHYQLGKMVLKGYYLNPENYLSVKVLVTTVLFNLYNLLLIIVWLWI